ncbi:hypothetical protein D6779_02975 [Candidatus Parcubacteria bacterium]|nr:MAG: hypothetical protein D6779_02975 [Candidatus Parcubacteria bacterium]
MLESNAVMQCRKYHVALPRHILALCSIVALAVGIGSNAAIAIAAGETANPDTAPHLLQSILATIQSYGDRAVQAAFSFITTVITKAKDIAAKFFSLTKRYLEKIGSAAFAYGKRFTFDAIASFLRNIAATFQNKPPQ